MEKSLTPIPTIPKGLDEAYEFTVKAVGTKPLSRKLQISIQHALRMVPGEHKSEIRKNIFAQSYDAVKMMLDRGYLTVAFVVADAFASLIGGEIAFRNHTPDKDTYQEEILDLSVAVTNLLDICQAHIVKKATHAQVRAIKKDAHKAVDEIVEKSFRESKRMAA